MVANQDVSPAIDATPATSRERIDAADASDVCTRRLGALQALSTELAELLTPDAAASVSVERAFAAMGADRGVVAFYQPDAEALFLVHGVGVPAETLRRTARLAVSERLPMAEAVRLREPVFVDNPDEIRARYPGNGPLLLAGNVHAVTAVPAFANGEVRAVIGLSWTRPHTLDEGERSFVVAVASQCAQALLRSRLYAEEQAAREAAEHAASHAQRLHAVASTLARALSPTDVIDAILREAIPAVGASSGAVLKLVDLPGESPEYRYLAGVGISPEVELKYRQAPADIARPAGDAWRTRRPVFIPDLAAWNACYPTPPTSAQPGRTPREGAWAAVPLEATGRMFGTLTLAFAGEREFSQEDRAFISTVAQHCAQALERGELYEKAVAANRAKTDFLAVMSHELRTPLTAILGYTELVADEIVGPVTDVQRDHLLRANSAGRHLLGVIEGLLTFARLEAGREQAHGERFRLEDLVDEIIGLVQPLARKKNLALRANCVSGSAQLITDRQKVRQILLNLLSNAVKFTREGEIVLEAKVQDALAIISVADTGPGIARENLLKVFDTFWQADQRLTRETGGTGLGLSIARHLARVLGGDIAVSSVVGQGSTFTLRFPVRLASMELG